MIEIVSASEWDIGRKSMIDFLVLTNIKYVIYTLQDLTDLHMTYTLIKNQNTFCVRFCILMVWDLKKNDLNNV